MSNAAAVKAAATDPAPATTPAPIAAAVRSPATASAPSIAALKQKPQPGGLKLASTPQGSAGQQSGSVDAVTGVSAQPAIGKDTQSTTTSTSPAGDITKPKVTDDGNKFEPGRVGGNITPRGGLAAAPNATLGQSGSSGSANTGKAFSGGSTSLIPVHSGKK